MIYSKFRLLEDNLRFNLSNSNQYLFFVSTFSTRPRYEEAASSASVAVNNRANISRPDRPGTSGVTNGRRQISTDDDTDVDITGSPTSRTKYARKRPLRGKCVCFV